MEHLALLAPSHVEREAVREARKQLHGAWGWFGDEVAVSSRSALDLHHIWKVKKLPAEGEGRAGLGGDAGMGQEGGAEERGTFFFSSVSFFFFRQK